MIARIIGLSILLILSLSLVIITGMMLFVDVPYSTDPGLLVLGFIVGLGLTGGGTWGIFRVNQAWTRQVRARFQAAEESGELLAHWHIAPEIWREFTTREWQTELRPDMASFLLLSSVCGGIVLLVAWRAVGFLSALVWASGIALGLGLLVFFVERVAAHLTHRWRRAQRDVQVWLHPDGLLINRKLIYWKQPGTDLVAVELIEDENGSGYTIFQVTVRVFTGNDTFEQSQRVPLTEEQADEARKAVARLCSGLAG